MNKMKFEIQRFADVWDYNYPQRLYIQRTHELTDWMRQNQYIQKLEMLQQERLILDTLERTSSSTTTQNDSDSEESASKVENKTENVIISAHNDLGAPLYNYANNVTIVGAGTGSSSVNNQGVNVIIAGFEDYKSKISNSGNDATILTGNYDDTISSKNSKHAVITTENGNDSVSISYISDEEDTENLVLVGDGNDTITSNGSGDIILGENGKDYIKVKADSYVQGGLGNDYIGFSGGRNIIYGNEGNDNIEGYYAVNVADDFNFVFAGDGDDTIKKGSYVLGSAGKDSITDGWVAFGGDDDDKLNGYTLSGGNGKDIIHTTEIGYGGNDDDEIFAENDYDTLIGGNGNDSLYAYEKRNNGVLLAGGDGDDHIIIGSEVLKNNTIVAGKGNDTIEMYYVSTYGVSSGALARSDDELEQVIYTDGDGDDYIKLPQYASYSTGINLEIIGNDYSTIQSGDNIIVNVGSGHITLASAAYMLKNNKQCHININLNKVTAPDIDALTSSLDELEKYLEDVANPPADSSSISSGEQEIPSQNINNVNNTYTYNGGNKTISNYAQGQVVQLASDYQGIDVSGDSFFVNSSNGQLEIQNSRDKFIGYSGSDNNVVAYSYLGAKAGVIDGRDKSQAEIFIGGDHVDNQIYAGNGGSSLWGGNGGADTLTGGEGYDEFFFAMGSGVDVIQNAGDNDVVNLLGVSLSQISSFSYDSSSVNLQFNDGGNLRVESTSSVGYRVENQTFFFNRATNEWANK